MRSNVCRYCGEPLPADGRSCTCRDARKDFAAKLYRKYYANERNTELTTKKIRAKHHKALKGASA